MIGANEGKFVSSRVIMSMTDCKGRGQVSHLPLHERFDPRPCVEDRLFIEGRLFIEVEGHDLVYAIVDEDLERENA
jgi:hypothetical protein